MGEEETATGAASRDGAVRNGKGMQQKAPRMSGAGQNQSGRGEERCENLAQTAARGPVQKTPRMVWVDVGRGAAILMIVASHLIRTGPVTDYLGSAAVALFFYLSGYVCDPQQCVRAGSRAAYWKKRFRRIYLPYVGVGVFSILVYAAGGRFAARRLGVTARETGILRNLGYLLYANSKSGRMKWNETLWFLPCFMIVLLLAALIEEILAVYRVYDGGTQRQTRERIFLTVDSVLLGYLFSQALRLELPWHAETAFTMVLFYEAGILWRAVERPAWMRRRGALAAVFLVLFAASVLLTRGNDVRAGGRLRSGISIRGDIYPHFLLSMLILALCVTAFCLLAGWMTGWEEKPGAPSEPGMLSRALAFLGQRSLDIMLWNKFPVLAVQLGLGMVSPHAARWVVGNNTIPGLLLSLLLAVLCALLCVVWSAVLQAMGRRTAAGCGRKTLRV